MMKRAMGGDVASMASCSPALLLQSAAQALQGGASDSQNPPPLGQEQQEGRAGTGDLPDGTPIQAERGSQAVLLGSLPLQGLADAGTRPLAAHLESIYVPAPNR